MAKHNDAEVTTVTASASVSNNDDDDEYSATDTSTNAADTSNLSLKSLNLSDNNNNNNKINHKNGSYYSKSYNRNRNNHTYQKPDSYHKTTNTSITAKATTTKTNGDNNNNSVDLDGINPIEFTIEKEINLEKDKFFVIKSFSAQDVYNSIRYKIWCSTEAGNVKLNDAYKECNQNDGNVYLFFSVNGSGYFCGMARMISEVDLNWQPDANFNLWSHSTKWKGKFNVKWLYVKNVPNRQLSYIKLENNENKPVTHSRDCQLVPSVNGIHVMKIIHYYHHYSSILDESDGY